MVVIDEMAERIRMWFTDRPQPPYKVDFFITERCNLKCRFCNFPFIGKKRYSEELTKKELHKIVDYCGKNGVKIIGILGGEPFVRKELLVELMKKIKEYGIDGSIVTNGTLIDDKTICELVKIEWDLIRFSIDGTEKIHDLLRGKEGSFKLAVGTIKKLNKLKRKLKKTKPKIEMNTVLCNKNYKQLPDIINLASRLECNYVYILPMIEFTEVSKELRILNKENVKKYLLRTKKISEKLKISTNINEIIKSELIQKSNKTNEIILPSERINDKSYTPCFQPWYTISIDALGNVTPCCNLTSVNENIRKKDLNEIWLGQQFNEIRDNMKNRKLPKECSHCCMPLIDENRNLREKVL